MSRCSLARSLWLSLVLLLARPCLADRTSAGRDVTIALFTTHPVAHLLIAPVGPEAWTARCATCPHEMLHAPRTLAVPGEIFAGGALRVTDPASGIERATTGLWHLRATPQQSTFDVTVQVPSEQYVAAVLNAEAAPAEPEASLRSLAIVARTYALNGSHYTAASGHLPAELCDSTACQALRFAPSSAAVQQAVRQTAGETLWFQHERAAVFFSQHCGGVTEDAAAIAPRLRNVPYLRSHPDPFCQRQGSAAWHADIPLQNLYALAAAQNWPLPKPLEAVTAASVSSSGRVSTLDFKGVDGRALHLSAVTFRLAVGRAFGWNMLRSDLYQLSLRHNSLVFDGRGHGHGVGLCQTGAQEMAHQGKSIREILTFYFPGTQVRIQPEDQGWKFDHLSPVTTQANRELFPDEQSAVRMAWADAAAHFPMARSPLPTVVFAPSPELFRQLTHQPGWDLASTQGDYTVLQSTAVLQANHVSLRALLLHEFLHGRVEAEASTRAPLWLREGLVEVLGDEAARPAAERPHPALAASSINRLLQSAGSRAQAQTAHRAAAAMVQALERRYTSAVVRGWLSTGVPTGVVP